MAAFDSFSNWVVWYRIEHFPEILTRFFFFLFCVVSASLVVASFDNLYSKLKQPLFQNYLYLALQ